MSRVPLPRWVLPVLLGACAACGKNPVISLEIVTPTGEDTVAGATRLRVRNATPATENEISLVGGAEITLDLSDVTAGGDSTTVTVDALDDAGTVLAHGSTPPFNLLPAESFLRIYVGRTGAVGEAPGALAAGRTDVGLATMAGLGALIVGGADASGAPVAVTTVYNEYLHQVAQAADIGAARAGVTVFEASDSVVVAFGGRTAGGVSSLMEVFDPWQGYTGVWVAYSAEGVASLARAFAPAAVLTDGVLCAGGTDGADAPLASAVTMVAGDAPLATALTSPLAAARAGHTVTPQLDGGAALIYGGAVATDAPVAERYSPGTQTFTPLDLDAALMRSRHSATLLGDGRVAIIGGVDAAGAARADVIVVAADGTAALYEAVLQTPRARHTATLVGGAILVAGGADDAGTLADAEVVETTTFTVAGTAPLRGARAGHAPVLLASGTVLIAGGVDGDGAPLARLELYTPAQ
ncbi:MAG: hypothetical protein HY906_12285 [Deltaproteobacteria bacterium]|nr:hypothetical protein [Deltaproteobacteria bacterium]